MLGLAQGPTGQAFAPYKRQAAELLDAMVTELARTVGGGECGVIPSSMLATAAQQKAWQAYFSDLFLATGEAEHAERAARLGDQSRQNQLAAYELCAKQAKALPRGPVDPLAAFRDRGDA